MPFSRPLAPLLNYEGLRVAIDTCSDPGVLQLRLDGVPPGLGDPPDGGLEALLARAILSIPDIRGVEFSCGPPRPGLCGEASSLDPEGSDGLVDGVSSGNPIVLRLTSRQRGAEARDPTPSKAVGDWPSPSLTLATSIKAAVVGVLVEALLRQKASRGDPLNEAHRAAMVGELDRIILDATTRRVELARAEGRQEREKNDVNPLRRGAQDLQHWIAMASERGLDPFRSAALGEALNSLCQEARKPAAEQTIPVLLSDGPADLVRLEQGLVARRPWHADAPVVGACLSLTSRCNEHCIMCMEQRDPKECYDLPLAHALQLARAVAGAVPIVNSSASEALLYTHFLEVARFIRDHGSAVGVVTNGLALARNGFLAQCVDAGLRQVMLSCHTSREPTFGLLTGLPKGFPSFLQALRNLDAHNRSANAEQRIRVVVEVVVMRPLLDEIDELIAFIDSRLEASRPLLRIESMRMMSTATAHAELQPSIDELARAMRQFLDRHADTHELSVRFIPLCLLAGHEHLASEVPQVLRREKTVGNEHCRGTELVELMRPASALSQPAWQHICAECTLACVCPGVHDIPVPPGSAFPRRSFTPLAEVAARLVPPLEGEEFRTLLAEVDRERREGSGPRLSGANFRLLAPLLEKLRASGATVATSPQRIEIEFADPSQASGKARIILTAAGSDLPHFRSVGGLQFTHVGEQTPRMQRVTQVLTLHLERAMRGAP